MLTQSIGDRLRHRRLIITAPPGGLKTIECAALMRGKVPDIFSDAREYFLLLAMQLMLLEPSAKTKG